MKRLIFWITVCAALMVAGCDPPKNDTVVIPTTDSTAPKAALDAHLDGGTVSVTSDGANPATASVGTQGTIALIASGTDEDGGVQDIQIWYTTAITSCNAAGICSTRGPGLAGAPVVSNPDSPKSPGGSAMKTRLTSHNLDMAALRTAATTSIRVEIWAEAVNFHGAKTRTPVLTLNWP